MLENRLVLHRFLCQEFGYDDLTSMLAKLKDAPIGCIAGKESEYAHRIFSNQTRIDWQRLADYDIEITELSQRLNMNGNYGLSWQPHQWLAMLFVEHYLHRYFWNSEILCYELNEAKNQQKLTKALPDYTIEDLSAIAIQSATGSGKTLVMHANILQYRRLSKLADKSPNNVILVTPNEQLSAQHERDFMKSSLPARVFSSEARGELMASVEILDVNKLAEKKGVKRVAVSDFGINNLVMVDEGHLGASGKVWRTFRSELAKGGFTFEYSATFNQIVRKDNELRNSYSKSILFDYTYRSFYTDGYGKDYAISNLPQGDEDANSNMYLLGCLLSFYRQYRIWHEGRSDWTEFNVTQPLWVFLGKTVTGGNRTKANQEIHSDVVRILKFFGWFLAHGDSVVLMIARLVSGESGLNDEAGLDYFSDQFTHLEKEGANNIYDDICQKLFHGQGRLRIRYLTQGEGELHLHTSDNTVFGLVNVGDSAALYKLLLEGNHTDMIVERESGFARRLFADVDHADSHVNVVIGARRFLAGWNSWRVSTMGLMHVGVGEGPEIIQMFGRGVRLMGWKMSLKRHRESGAELPVNSHLLAELETLRIFGLRSNYMQTFKDILEKEGIGVERKTLQLPVTWNFAKQTDLKVIRLKDDLKYEHSDDRPVLGELNGIKEPKVKIDYYSQLQIISSDNNIERIVREKKSVNILSYSSAVFNRLRIYDKLLARKRQMGWHNLSIQRDAVYALLDREDWYELYLPPEKLEVNSYSDLQKLEDIAIELVSEYITEFWKAKRRRWELKHLEIRELNKSDPNNIGEYSLSVDAREEALIEYVRMLISNLPKSANVNASIESFTRDTNKRFGELPKHLSSRLKLCQVISDLHAYKPLLYTTGKGEVTVQPVPLDINEKEVVEKLTDFAYSNADCLQNRKLYLIRNLSRGRGVSFFDDYAYYPDFIVWVVNNKCQHIIFLDPKGLVWFGSKESKKVELHKTIKKIEGRLNEKNPNLYLHAYVLSITHPDKIGDRLRTKQEWEELGVYFLKQDNNWPQRILKDALQDEVTK